MKNSTIGLIATSLAVLLSGLSGFFIIPLLGGISALIPYMPSATLTVVSSIVDPNSALANGVGSCCICIPIPLAFGIFALIQRANASAREEPPSQPDADI